VSAAINGLSHKVPAPFRIWCKFEPDHINAPAGRKGQWRVVRCIPLHFDARAVLVICDQLGIVSSKPYQKGSIIRPHKELRKVLKARSRRPPCPKHTTGGGPCYCPGSIYQPHQ
jgi:hypothetical protein